MKIEILMRKLSGIVMESETNETKEVQKIKNCAILLVGGDSTYLPFFEGLKKIFKDDKVGWLGNTEKCDLHISFLDILLESNFKCPFIVPSLIDSNKKREFYFSLCRESQEGINMSHAEYEFNTHVSLVFNLFYNSKIKKIIFTNVPHLRWQIAIEVACMKLSVKYIALLPTNFQEIRGISKFNKTIEYMKLEKPKHPINIHSDLQHKRLKKTILKQKYDYMVSASIMKKLLNIIKTAIIFLTPSYLLSLFSLLIWPSKDNFKVNNLISRDFSMGERKYVSRTLYFNNLKKKLKNIRGLYNELNLHSKDIDLNIKKFIYYPLHYQPEATTMPMSQDYVDQISFIKELAFLLETIDLNLVIKEHPTTLNIRFRGDRGRFKNYYKKLLNIPNVSIAKIETSNQFLLKESIAVVALTGTAAVEKASLGGLGILMGGHYALGSYELLFQASDVKNILKIIKDYLQNNLINQTSQKSILFDISNRNNIKMLAGIL